MNTQQNLLIGVLALQCHLVTSEQLVAALETWVADKARSLTAIFIQQRALDAKSLSTLQALFDKHLAQHANSVDRSLAVFSVVPTLKDELLKITDIELRTAVSALSLGASSDHAVATLEATVRQTGNPQASEEPPAMVKTMLFSTEDSISEKSKSTPATNLRFRILRPHAKGGLGEVFLAQDQELNREVALKEIQLHHAGRKTSRARFLLEAEITGALEHPGIVPVYGLGSYPDGRPYYAMRFIRGDGFDNVIERYHKTDWSKRSAGAQVIELRQLLRRFIDVCNAIDFAHNHGVLHRDLKPANIMLGKYGETLVVDWGLAKMVDRPESATDSQVLHPLSAGAAAGTQMGTALGTPSFMSPEQAAGLVDDLGPASDVYSLGATLYVLLTNRPAFVDHDVEAILQKVREGRFIAPRQMNRAVPKPLDAICLRAMALKASDRYRSARALADDVEHWLADEATVAYRESWRERALRWARRHKTWTQAGAAAVALVAITAITASVLINRSREREALARASAEESFLKARATVDDFFTRISENKLLNVPGLQPLRKELLEAASQYYQGFIAQREHDPSLRAELAETHYRLGLIANETDSKQAALASLERAYDLQQALQKETPNTVEVTTSLANTANAIGNVKQEMGDFPASLKSFTEAMGLREALVKADAKNAALQRKLANSHNNVAAVLARQGNRDESEKEFTVANQLRLDLAHDFPATSIYQRDLGQGYFNFAVYKKEADDLAGALAASQLAIDVYRELVEKDPRVIDYRRELAQAYRVRGDIEADLGHAVEALTAFQEAQKVAEVLAQQNPLLLELQADVAAIYANIGRLKQRTAELPQAVEWYSKSHAIREQLAIADPTVERFQMDLASCELHLGMAELDVGSLADAQRSFRSALRGYTALAAKNPRDSAIADGVAQTQRNIGLVYRAQGDSVQALAAFEETKRIFERLAAANPKSLVINMGWADALLNIAVDCRALGRTDDALSAARQAAEIQANLAKEHPDAIECQYVYVETLYMLGLIHLGEQDVEAAQRVYEKSVSILEKLTASRDDNLKYRSMLGITLDKRAVSLWMLSRQDEALAAAKRAGDMLRSAMEAAPQVAQYRLNLSENCINLAKFERDLGHPAEAMAITLERKNLWPTNVQEQYRAALELAAVAQSVSEDPAAATDENRTLRASAIREATEALSTALATGWSDIDQIRTNPKFDVLRKSPEFQKLLAKPAKKRTVK